MALAMAIGSQEFQSTPKRIDLNPSLVYFAQVIPCNHAIIPIVKGLVQ
jgi:hypothetical protein